MVLGLSLYTYVLRVPIFYISCSNSWCYEVQKIFDFQDSDLEIYFVNEEFEKSKSEKSKVI